jgi:hypothetical protein
MSIEQTKKLNELLELVNTPLDVGVENHEVKKNDPYQQPPMVYFMAGTILGSVIAVILVIYMNKSIVNKHMNIKNRKR